MIGGPEIATMEKGFEEKFLPGKTVHESPQGIFCPKIVLKTRRSLVNTFEELRNPFIENSDDFLVIDTRMLYPKTLCIVTGQEQYKAFVKEIFIDRNKPIIDKSLFEETAVS